MSAMYLLKQLTGFQSTAHRAGLQLQDERAAGEGSLPIFAVVEVVNGCQVKKSLRLMLRLNGGCVPRLA